MERGFGQSAVKTRPSGELMENVLRINDEGVSFSLLRLLSSVFFPFPVCVLCPHSSPCRSHCSSPSRPLLRRNELHYPGGLIKLQQLDAVGRFMAWFHPELSERRPGRLSRRAKSSSRFKFWCHFHRKNRSTECGSSMCSSAR